MPQLLFSRKYRSVLAPCVIFAVILLEGKAGLAAANTPPGGTGVSCSQTVGPSQSEDSQDARKTQLAQLTVNSFFQHYAFITDWAKFQTEQTPLFSSTAVTTTRDHTGTKEYQGAAGYFDSLGDWSKWFSTDDPRKIIPSDFRLEIVESSPSKIVVRLHGNIFFHQPIQGVSQISDSQHKWTETFTLDSNGKIQHLEVDMNLFK